MFQVVHRLIPRDWGYGGKSRRVAGLETDIRIYWRRFVLRLVCCMAKKPEAVDNLLESLVWMRRKAKKHEAVDDLIDALMKMRRNVKKKAVIGKRKTNERKRKTEELRRKTKKLERKTKGRKRKTIKLKRKTKAQG